MKKLNYAKNALLLIIVPFLSFYLMECFLRNPWDEKWGLKLSLLIINTVFHEIVAVILFAIIGRLRWSLRLQTISCFLFGLLEYYVQRFRGKPIVPWDITSAGTAASVANNFDYFLDMRGKLVIAGFIALLVLTQLADAKFPSIKKEKKALIPRIAVALTAFILLFPYTAFCQSTSTIKKYKIYDKLFTPTTIVWRDGIAFSMLYELQFMTVDKPAGYSEQAMKETLASYASDAESTSTEDLPNIIVIMDEAFSDPAILGDFKTNEDYMPFVHSLQNGAENAITGYMNCSVVGGNTPNTEFEYLTGNSLAFLPQGSIAYQQFVNGKIDAMPSYLKSLGYDTLGMHPYKATGWDRDRVYPLLGFDKAHFIDYFEARNPKYVRNYVSDETLFDQIINEYESRKKNSSAPFFSFNVTMQNHSEYSGELVNFEPEITVDGLGDTLITRYLSLEKITDEALKNFCDYFSKTDDKTIIVFFGDHQPTDYVVEPIWKMNGKTGSDLSFEDMTKRYKVPFVIWANYDIEEQSGIETSANYLGNLTLKTAGIPLDPYRSFTDAFSEKYPVISAIHAADANGNDASIDDTDADGSLSDYRKMQYYELFDDKDDYE